MQVRPQGRIFLHSFFPLSKDSRKYVSVYWKDNLYQSLCLYFDLAPKPYIFTKLLKVPINLLPSSR